MPAIDLSILNQRQTPAFYADTLANRPAAGFVGRIFVSTDTFAFYRDNGTTWDLIGGPGTGTITGSGANGQVSYWNGASTITGSNDLFFDAVNGHLGIGTITPGTALDVKHDQNTVVQLEQVTATNDNRIAFINNGVGLWRIGSFYNAGANDFGLFDIAAATQPVTVKRTTGQVLIGTSTVGSGKLVVASSTGDNGVQIVGASAPSLRIDNAESGPTLRIGMGISTASNNFIQGSVNGDMCIFNGSTGSNYPMLFGIYSTGTSNIQEAARISTIRNFLIGKTSDSGQKLQVSGTALITGNVSINTTYATRPLNVGGIIAAFDITNTTDNQLDLFHDGTQSVISATYGSTGSYLPLTLRTSGLDRLYISSAGNVGIGTTSPNAYTNYTTLTINGSSGGELDFESNNVLIASMYSSSSQFVIETATASPLILKTNFIEGARISTSQNLLIGTTTDAGQKLQVNGTTLIKGVTTIDTSSTNQLYLTGGTTVQSRILIERGSDDSAQGMTIGYSNITSYRTTTPLSQPQTDFSLRQQGSDGTRTNLYMDDSGNIQIVKSLSIGNSVAAAVAAPSTHKVSILIGGVQYYLLASNV